MSLLRQNKIGSLFEEDGGYCYTVKAGLSPGYILDERFTCKEICNGPFYQESDYYKSLLSAYRYQIRYLPMDHHLFFAPVPVSTEYGSFESYKWALGRWNDFAALGGKFDSNNN
jgi:hypothetical protein